LGHLGNGDNKGNLFVLYSLAYTSIIKVHRMQAVEIPQSNGGPLVGTVTVEKIRKHGTML